MKALGVGLCLFLMSNCNNADLTDQANDNSIFTEVDPESIGIDFYNGLYETKDFNIVTYEYIYNGGGVGIGDFNNDGLKDIFFTGTISPDQLYYNLGDFTFENVTARAGIIEDSTFTTGVVVVDINQDGYDDIYVCKTGKEEASSRVNRLYVNQQDGTFLEQGSIYGIASDHHSNHANFFDYDNDGDLDLYILNHPVDFDNSQQIRVRPDSETGGYRRIRTPKTGYDSDQLFRNDGDGIFVDVTEEAGISNYGYGLSISIIDVNDDGWDDIYIANDYIETDMLYINQQDGTFINELSKYFSHISENSMGSDAADVDDDGDLDLIVLDMVPETSTRQKQLLSSMSYKRFTTLKTVGYEPQIMKNVFQLNSGQDGFHEASYMFGVSNTDWSWAPLFSDYDNDGDKDLLITNGFRRDITDCDYTNYKSDSLKKMDFKEIQEYYDLIPENPVKNYLYRQDGPELNFQNVTDEWGIKTPTFSNGAAYADLDNNGTLDLIVNNNDGRPSIYKNSVQNHYIRLRLRGSSSNLNALGAKVELTQDEKVQHRTLRRTRGYFSSVEKELHFGVTNQAYKVKVIWPDGKQSLLSGESVDTTILIGYDQESPIASVESPRQLFNLTEDTNIPNFNHKENDHDDFNIQGQIITKHSEVGPRISKIKNNQNTLIFVPAPAGQASEIWAQDHSNGRINSIQKLEGEHLYEDIEGFFTDVDQDGDYDLIVLTGGGHFQSGDDMYRERLYIYNDGQYNLSMELLPNTKTNASTGVLLDYDDDGDEDLFVGSMVIPGSYPRAESALLLKNEGGRFIDARTEMTKELGLVGMVRDAFYADVDADGHKELGVIGEFLGLQLYSYIDGKLSLVNTIENSGGLWNTLLPTDIDNDGDLDFIAGNIGLNTNYKATAEDPLTLYAIDYDRNGQIDPIIVQPYVDGNFPIMTRGEILQQLPILQRTLKDYQKYSHATINDLLDAQSLEKAMVLKAHTLASGVFMNNGGEFSFKELPKILQIFPIYAISEWHQDEEGNNLYLLGGNEWNTNVHSGPNDGGYLMAMKYDQSSNEITSEYVLNNKSLIKGEIRSILIIDGPEGNQSILVGRNENSMLSLQWNSIKGDL